MAAATVVAITLAGAMVATVAEAAITAAAAMVVMAAAVAVAVAAPAFGGAAAAAAAAAAAIGAGGMAIGTGAVGITSPSFLLARSTQPRPVAAKTEACIALGQLDDVARYAPRFIKS